MLLAEMTRTLDRKSYVLFFACIGVIIVFQNRNELIDTRFHDTAVSGYHADAVEAVIEERAWPELSGLASKGFLHTRRDIFCCLHISLLQSFSVYRSCHSTGACRNLGSSFTQF